MANTWEIGENGYPVPINAPDIIEPAMTAPYPASLWRIDPEWNNGYPFNLLQPDIPHRPTPVIIPVNQRPYVTLYRYDTPQDGFEGHGMWVLTPTKCTITEVLNGKYELSMEHPIDPEGRWEYIRENNIVKAMGQLFTIRVVNQQWKGSTGKIVAKGDHIFYQLNDGLIERTTEGETSGITGNTVAQVMRQAMELVKWCDRTGLTRYHFHGASNMALDEQYIWAQAEFLEKDTNFVEFFMGSGGVLEASGGKLNRDNFDYSVYAQKEGSKQNAFEVRVGKNLTGIKRTIDTSSQFTYLDAYNNYGDGISRDISATDMQRYGIPHHIVRRKDYSYTTRRQLPAEVLRETAWYFLKQDSLRDIKTYGAPLVSYEVDMFEVKNNPEYSDTVDLGGYAVGNSGTIVDPYMGTLTMEITQTTTDALTGEVTQIVFGNRRDFVGQPAQSAVIDIEPETVDIYFYVSDSAGFFCKDSSGALIVEHEGV